MFAAWVLFPVVLLAVCLGCGLLADWAGGRRLAGPLLPAVGLAVVIVVATLTTERSETASWTTPAVVVLSVAGYATSWRRVAALRPDGWLVAAGLATYTVCAAPVVLSGNATLLGYYVDTDPAFHLELTTWLLAHGRDLTGVPVYSPSAVTNMLHEYISSSYPLGADVAVGAVRPLAGQALAWIYQPYMAVVMALTPLALGEVLRDAVPRRPMRALAVFIVATGGLIYAFYLQASVKEIVVILLLPAVVVLVVDLVRGPLALRAVIPLAVVVAAGLAVYSAAIVPWVGIPLAVWLAVTARRWVRTARRGWSWEVAVWPAAAAVVIAAAIPFVAGASVFLTAAQGVLGQQQHQLGNLAAPLSPWQTLGIWPSGDFRYAPLTGATVAHVFIGVATASAVLGIAWMLRRRALAPLLFLVGNGVAALYLYGQTSPYAASKVLTLVTAPILMAAVLGAVALTEYRRRLAGGLVGAVIAAVIVAGVLWTNFLAYHDSSVAPRARFAELAAIGTRFAHDGSALYDQWDTYPLYFMREESVAIPSTWAGPAPLATATAPVHSTGQPSTPWDVNDMASSYVQGFRVLVLGRSPTTSRPPADFQLAYRGHYYDVWRRTATPTVIEHIPLTRSDGTDHTPASACRAIRAAAAVASSDHARLAYVPRPSLPTFDPTTAQHPPAWAPLPTNGFGPTGILAVGQAAGAVTGTLDVPEAGRYQVWLQGSHSRRVIVSVGGHAVGSVTHQIGTDGQYTQVGTVQLGAGTQAVRITRPPATHTPGDLLGGDAIGRLVLVRNPAPLAVHEVAPTHAGSLCGRALQWVEVVR
ncbi:MAG TPA: hypothetical protein VHW96_09700 [Solirubrobacteraceae bacterium]|nr:hypothetical protein [Solirubrobacteraceae bacterium]